MTRLLPAILVPVLACASGQAKDPSLPVVMVADLEGKVVRGSGQLLTLAEGIPPQRALTLAPGARLVVIHLQTGEELVFTGPCALRFDAEGRPLGAKPSDRRTVATLHEGFRLEPGAWAQASVVIRKEFSPDAPRVLEEEPMPFQPASSEGEWGVWLQPRGSATLDRRPEFRWRLSLPGLAARLRLTDPGGGLVCDELIQGDRFRLPLAKALPAQAGYRWRLSWTPPGEEERSVEGTFAVLSEVEARLIGSLRPAPEAPFAERLAFAVALESRGLLEEAAPYWKRLAEERPWDSTLQRFVHP